MTAACIFEYVKMISYRREKINIGHKRQKGSKENKKRPNDMRLFSSLYTLHAALADWRSAIRRKMPFSLL